MSDDLLPGLRPVLQELVEARVGEASFASALITVGAETIAQSREREAAHADGKPQFGEVAKVMGEGWEDSGPEGVEGAVSGDAAGQEERVFSGPLVR